MEIKPICRFKLRALAAGAREFYASSKFLRSFEIDRFVEFWRPILAAEIGVIFVAEDDGEIIGAIGAMSHPDPYSGELVVQEFFWFVRPGHRGSAGLRLYEALEFWARQKGAKVMRMVHLMDSMPEKLSRVYKRLGYEQVEILYSKDLAA